MSESDAPPIVSEAQPGPQRPRWRWGMHVALLATYVLALGIAGALAKSHGKGEPTTSAMPGDLRSLMIMCVVELGAFALVFLIAWLFSRAGRDELLLNWRGGLRPILYGVVYSVLLRVVIAFVVIATLIPVFFGKGKGMAEKFRPKTEAIVNMEAMKDPAYVAFAVTVVSFVMAGFREELWRVGMLAGLAGLAPGLFGAGRGRYWAVAIAAILFGLGHLPQGVGGVIATTTLGMALGWIIVRHQSIWEAVLAHGFFDATTFAGLYVIAKYFPEVLRGLGGVA